MRRASRTSEVPSGYNPFEDEEKEQWRESQQPIYDSPKNGLSGSARESALVQSLFNEYPVPVFPTLAKAIGIWPSVLLNKIDYWAERVNARKKNSQLLDTYWDGKHWCHLTIDEWVDQLEGLLSSRTIDRHLKTLRDKRLIITAQLSKDPRDVTNYYRVDYERLMQVIGEKSAASMTTY